jgi:hypothetical protein
MVKLKVLTSILLVALIGGGGALIATEPAEASASFRCCDCECICTEPNPLQQCRIPIYELGGCVGAACGSTTINCGSGPGGFCQT